MGPSVFPHPGFPDHALLDSGGGEKLERFGAVTLRRPDPQALWKPRLPADEWARAHLAFVRESDRFGRWEPGPDAPEVARRPEPEWSCRFGPAMFRIRPTPFKHVGLFPEQAANWEWLARVARELGSAPRLLNLFGYTGCASVLARLAGYDVTHVDASKASVGWALDNAVASGLPRDALRVIVDDALAFARREVRRGSRYHAVLLDPPHHGRGPRGERWQFEQGIAPLVEVAASLLEPRAVLLLSTYAIGYSPLALENLLADACGGAVVVGELAVPEESGARLLPAGFSARAARGLSAEALE